MSKKFGFDWVVSKMGKRGWDKSKFAKVAKKQKRNRFSDKTAIKED